MGAIVGFDVQLKRVNKETGAEQHAGQKVLYEFRVTQEDIGKAIRQINAQRITYRKSEELAFVCRNF